MDCEKKTLKLTCFVLTMMVFDVFCENISDFNL